MNGNSYINLVKAIYDNFTDLNCLLDDNFFEFLNDIRKLSAQYKKIFERMATYPNWKDYDKAKGLDTQKDLDLIIKDIKEISLICDIRPFFFDVNYKNHSKKDFIKFHFKGRNITEVIIF